MGLRDLTLYYFLELPGFTGYAFIIGSDPYSQEFFISGYKNCVVQLSSCEIILSFESEKLFFFNPFSIVFICDQIQRHLKSNRYLIVISLQQISIQLFSSLSGMHLDSFL